MSNNQLKLNEEKTEFLIAGTETQPSKVIIDSLNVVGIDIKPSTSVRNLGVIIDQDLSLKEQVNAICRSCYGHLRSIIEIRPYLSKSAAHTIVQSLISSRLDYCNSLLAELPQYLLNKLQKVQNWAARIVLNVKKHDSISVHLHQLHWWPVRFRIKFKINLLVKRVWMDRHHHIWHQCLTTSNINTPQDWQENHTCYKRKDQNSSLWVTVPSVLWHQSIGMNCQLISGTFNFHWTSSKRN